MIAALIANLLQSMINPLIHLDPECKARLKPLDGKVLKINITNLNLALILTTTDQGLEIFFNETIDADASLEGTWLDLLELGLSKNQQATLAQGKIKQTGNSTVLMQYQQFWQGLEIDWEGKIAELLGDTMTHYLLAPLKKAQQLGKRNLNHSKLDWQEYLQVEIRLLPTQEETQDLGIDIRELQLDIDRLEARLKLRLEKPK